MSCCALTPYTKGSIRQSGRLDGHILRWVRYNSKAAAATIVSITPAVENVETLASAPVPVPSIANVPVSTTPQLTMPPMIARTPEEIFIDLTSHTSYTSNDRKRRATESVPAQKQDDRQTPMVCVTLKDH